MFVSVVSCGEISIEPDHIYLSKRIDIDSKTIRTTFVSQNGEMAFCVTEADDTNAVNVTKIKTYDRDSDSFSSTELKPYFDDELDMNILNITATPDGGYFAQTSYSKYIPEKDESEAVYTGFTKYDSDGNAVFFKSADSYPSVAPDPSLTEYTEYAAFRAAQDSISDADGNIYIIFKKLIGYSERNDTIYTEYDENITILSPEGEFITALYESDLDVYGLSNCSFALDSDKSIMIVENQFGSYHTRYIDIENGCLTPAEPTYKPYLLIYFDYDGNYYYQNSFGFYNIVKDENGNPSENLIFDWATVGISTSIIKNMIVKNESELFIEILDGELPEYYHVKKFDISEAPERINLTIAIDGAKATTVSMTKFFDAVSRFNRSSDEYRMVFVSYSSTEGGLSASQKLADDISSGKVPDMIVFDGDLSYELLQKKVKFADLYKYLDSDEEYSRDNIISCLYKPYETRSGKLNCIATSYSNYTLSVDTAITGNIDGWTVADMLNINASLGDDEYFMALSFDDRESASEAVLSELLSGIIPEFVELEKGKCDLTGLSELLELCKTAKLYNTFGREIDEQQNAKVAVEATDLNNIYTYYESLVLGIQNKTNVGYPGTKEKSSGSAVLLNAAVAVTKSCDHPEIAWELIKEVFVELENEWSFGNQKLPLPTTILPATHNSVDVMNSYSGKALLIMNAKGYTGMRGKLSLTPIPSDGKAIEFTAENNQYLIDSIENYDRVIIRYYSISSMIKEEASYYFSGAKSLDEVVKIITDRVETLVSEQF